MTTRARDASSSSKTDPQGVLAAILVVREQMRDISARHLRIPPGHVEAWIVQIDALLPDLRAALQPEHDPKGVMPSGMHVRLREHNALSDSPSDFSANAGVTHPAKNTSADLRVALASNDKLRAQLRDISLAFAGWREECDGIPIPEAIALLRAENQQFRAALAPPQGEKNDEQVSMQSSVDRSDSLTDQSSARVADDRHEAASDGARRDLRLSKLRGETDTKQAVARARWLEAENERLETLLNTPELHDFAKAVVLEAAHQRERWPDGHDANKTDADWFWLLGYLAGKALHNPPHSNMPAHEKQLHRIITIAAAAANWHAAVELQGAALIHEHVAPGQKEPLLDAVRKATGAAPDGSPRPTEGETPAS